MRLRNFCKPSRRVPRCEKDVGEADLLPELEHLLVSKQHVTARFQIEVLADPLASDRFPDCKAVPLLNERDIVNDESAPLPDRGEVLDHAFRAEQSIAAAVESPGAAERAVPRTPRENSIDSAGIEHADEIFAALAYKIARRPDVVEVLDEGRRGPSPSELTAPGTWLWRRGRPPRLQAA